MEKQTREENRLLAIAMVLMALIAMFGKVEVKDEEFYINAIDTTDTSGIISEDSTLVDSTNVSFYIIGAGHSGS